MFYLKREIRDYVGWKQQGQETRTMDPRMSALSQRGTGHQMNTEVVLPQTRRQQTVSRFRILSARNVGSSPVPTM